MIKLYSNIEQDCFFIIKEMDSGFKKILEIDNESFFLTLDKLIYSFENNAIKWDYTYMKIKNDDLMLLEFHNIIDLSKIKLTNPELLI